MSRDINCVTIVGRLTRDCESRPAPQGDGSSIVKFCIAVNSRHKADGMWVDDANFFDCVHFARANEAIAPFLVRGKLVGIIGELRQSKWEKDGEKRSKIEIVANQISLLANPSGQGDEARPSSYGRQGAYNSQGSWQQPSHGAYSQGAYSQDPYRQQPQDSLGTPSQSQGGAAPQAGGFVDDDDNPWG